MNDEPKVYPDPEPDHQGAFVRGVCGAVLGVVLAIGIWLRLGGLGLVGSIALFTGAVVTCTIGSMRSGDAFWHGVLRRRRQ